MQRIREEMSSGSTATVEAEAALQMDEEVFEKIDAVHLESGIVEEEAKRQRNMPGGKLWGGLLENAPEAVPSSLFIWSSSGV